MEAQGEGARNPAELNGVKGKQNGKQAVKIRSSKNEREKGRRRKNRSTNLYYAKHN